MEMWTVIASSKYTVNNCKNSEASKIDFISMN